MRVRQAGHGCPWLWLLLCVLWCAVPRQAWATDQAALVIGLPQEPMPGLDPTRGFALETDEITLYNVFETLTRITADGSVAPSLALSWTASNDGRTYTFRLRPGVRFHNGEAFDSRSVRFSLRRAGLTDSGNRDRAVFANIARIDTPDDLTVLLQLRSGDPDLPFKLGKAAAAMVEPLSADKNVHAPIGTGPYLFKHWQRGSSIVLERWGEHREARSVALTRVTFRFFSSSAGQLAALLSGEIHLLVRASVPRNPWRLTAEQGLQMVQGAGGVPALITMDLDQAVLRDERVRRAIRLAIDRTTLIHGSTEAPVSRGADLEPRNLRQAVALLAAAGVPRPLRLTMRVPPRDRALRMAQLLASQFAQAGIVLEVEKVAWEFPGPTSPRARDFDLALVVPPEAGQVGSAGGGFDTAGRLLGLEIDELSSRMHTTPDPRLRAEFQDRLRRLVAGDHTVIYLYQAGAVTVADGRLRGLQRAMPFPLVELSALRW